VRAGGFTVNPGGSTWSQAGPSEVTHALLSGGPSSTVFFSVLKKAQVNFQEEASSSCFLRDREPADRCLLSEAVRAGASLARAQSPQAMSKARKTGLRMVVR